MGGREDRRHIGKIYREKKEKRKKREKAHKGYKRKSASHDN